MAKKKNARRDHSSIVPLMVPIKDMAHIKHVTKRGGKTNAEQTDTRSKKRS